MGAAESRSALSALASEDDAAPDRLVRVPGSLTGGQAELRAAAAALIAQCGGALPGVEERGGIELEIAHIAQVGTWDCGVACIQMILSYAYGLLAPTQEEGEDVGRAALLAQVGAESIWTIDLLFLLQGYIARTGRGVLFATTAPGVCLQYAQVTYYARQFDRDVERVLERFKQAKEAGLAIYEGSLSWQTLRDLLLTGRFLLVLLVDARLLPRPTRPPPPTTPAPVASMRLPPTPTTPVPVNGNGTPTTMATGAYSGHYILLSGYRAHPPSFFYKDPARPTVGGDNLIDPATLDAARTAYGTDQDILLIEVPPPPSVAAGEEGF